MPSVSFTVPGLPPRKNRRTRTRVVVPRDGGAPFVHYYPSPDWRDWIERLAITTSCLPRITRGAWAIVVRIYSERQRHLDEGELHVADGDVDSVVSGVLDGLQEVKCLDNDVRILEERSVKHYDKHNPRTEVELRPWSMEGR